LAVWCIYRKGFRGGGRCRGGAAKGTRAEWGQTRRLGVQGGQGKLAGGSGECCNHTRQKKMMQVEHDTGATR